MRKTWKHFFLLTIYILIINTDILFDIKTWLKQGKKVRTISPFDNETNNYGKEQKKSTGRPNKLTRPLSTLAPSLTYISSEQKNHSKKKSSPRQEESIWGIAFFELNKKARAQDDSSGSQFSDFSSCNGATTYGDNEHYSYFRSWHPAPRRSKHGTRSVGYLF